jgi:hypothetical protein
MKRIIVLLSGVLLISTIAFAQEIKPTNILFDFLFPDVRNRIESMETQLSELRNDYVMYQHFQNSSIALQSLAAANFALANGWYLSYLHYGDTLDYDVHKIHWDVGWSAIEDSNETLLQSQVYGHRLGIYDFINNPMEILMNNMQNQLRKFELPKTKD